MEPTATSPKKRPSFFNQMVGAGVRAVTGPAAPIVASSAVKVANSVNQMNGRVLKAAAGIVSPPLANPVLKKATIDLATLLANPALQVAGWAKAFDTVGSNLVQAWGVNAKKHDWDKLSAGSTLPAKTFPTGIETAAALQEKVGPQKSASAKSMMEAFPELANGSERLGKLKEVADRLTPEQLTQLAKRLETFKAQPGVSPEFKNEVVNELIHDLANPLRADNACGPTCSSTSAQMRMMRDKPGDYAEIVLNMAAGKNHRLASGATIKAAYGEDTIKQLRQQGNASSASALLFQTNLQHFAASNVSMGKPIQNVFNPLFNGGLNKLFNSLDPKLGKDIDNGFVNKDLDKFNPLDGNRQTGHDPVQMEFLQQQLFPGAQAKSWLTDSPNQMWAAVEADLKKGKSVSASVFNPTPANPADRFHVITILGIDRKASPPQVHFHTWGGERTISLDDFKKSCALVAPGGK